VRVPSDQPLTRPRSVRRYQVWVVAAVVLIIVLIIALQALANFYTNYLWYRSVDYTMVWRLMIETKLVLAVVFCGLVFVALWSSLWVVDRIAPRALLVSPELEIVRRYQQLVGRHTFALRTVVSLFVAFLVGSGASGQWQNWLLFRSGKSFGTSDPQFGKNVGFFVFKLPFLSFLVDWSLVALLVVFVITMIGHYLNGGLRFQGPSPRVDPRVIAHGSLILAVMALIRSAGYFFVDRYALELRTDGVVNGMGYTSAHVRLPALELLTVIALVVFALLAFNVYRRSLAIPLVGAGLWAFVAITAGLIFPAAVQAFEVTPAQSQLEKPYILRNIDATRLAMNIGSIQQSPFAGNTDLNGGVVAADHSTLDNLPLWDPTVTQQTYRKLQQNGTGFTLGGLAVDRYVLDNVMTPAVIGVREVATGNLSAQTWVNTHLQFTHGYGAVLSPSNTFSNGGNPNFVIGSSPPVSSGGAPQIRNPSVYFGVNQSGYVVVDSRQREVDYPINGGSHYSTYTGTGGIPVGSFWTRAAFALRFHDLNLLISKLITPQSRIMYLQDVRARVAKVAPFLRVNQSPYPVVDNGHIDWIVDAYTTTSYYPYGQRANTSALPSGSVLNAGFNYVRNSVKVVIDAFSGKMTMYALTDSDPILATWESIFPGMFQPLSSMDATLQAHLRYPQDLMMLQAAMYGQYHLTNPSSFYSGNNTWQLAPTSGNGPLSETLPQDGFGNTLRFVPEYEVLQLPGDSNPQFSLVEPLDPHSVNDTNQSLAAFLTASSNPKTYGQIQAFVTQPGKNVQGPAIVNSRINSNPAVSTRLTLLGKQGSTISFGTTLIIPIADSLVYVRPLYVSSSSNAFPQLKFIIVVYGEKVSMEPTLRSAFSGLFGAAAAGIGTGGNAAIPAAVSGLLAQAQASYAAGLEALKRADLATYFNDMKSVSLYLSQARSELKAAKKTSGGGGSGSGSGTLGSGGSPGVTTTSTPSKTPGSVPSTTAAVPAKT